MVVNRNFGIALSPGPAAGCLIHRRHALKLVIVQSEKAGVAAEYLGAGKSPDSLGRRVEMAHAVIAIDDDDSIAGLLECCKQELGRLNRGVIVGAHRLTLGSSVSGRSTRGS